SGAVPSPGAEPAILGAFEDALAILREIGERRLEGYYLGKRAEFRLERGALGEADRDFDRALEVLREVGDVRHEGQFLASRAALFSVGGDEAKAAESFDTAEALLR